MTSMPRMTFVGLAVLAAVPLLVGAAAHARSVKESGLGYAEEVLTPGEVDPNDLAPGEEMPVAGAAKAAKTEAAVAEADDTHQAAEVMEVDEAPVVAATPSKKKKGSKSAKAEKPEPREIPLIETKNDAHSHEEVTYVTGGVGEDERASIEESKADYNLHVTNASKDGAFEGDTRVIITQQGAAEGDEMLDVVAGPLLYVRLPTGKYTATASRGERVITKNFEVKRKGKPVEVRLSW